MNKANVLRSSVISIKLAVSLILVTGCATKAAEEPKSDWSVVRNVLTEQVQSTNTYTCKKLKAAVAYLKTTRAPLELLKGRSRGPSITNAERSELAELLASLDNAQISNGIFTLDSRANRITILYTNANGLRVVCG